MVVTMIVGIRRKGIKSNKMRESNQAKGLDWGVRALTMMSLRVILARPHLRIVGTSPFSQEQGPNVHQIVQRAYTVIHYRLAFSTFTDCSDEGINSPEGRKGNQAAQEE